jgi:hypothetical protein
VSMKQKESNLELKGIMAKENFVIELNGGIQIPFFTHRAEQGSGGRMQTK